MKKAKLNNGGAALVSVLVITTFIAILATTFLYMAAMNYQNKLANYQNKQSFYNAEQALDELKSLMVEDVQEAYLEAYRQTSGQYLYLTEPASDDSKLKSVFQDEFNNKLKSIWEKRITNDAELSGTEQEKLTQAVRKLLGKPAVMSSDTENGIYKVAAYGVYTVTEKSKKKFVLRGVQSQYTYGNYTTFIYADICIDVPEPDWGGTAGKRSKTVFTDCISYMNWQRTDYDCDEEGMYSNVNESGIGELEEESEASPESATE